VLAFAGFCVWLVVSVQSLRQQLADNVVEIISLQAAQAALDREPPDWGVVASELKALQPAPASLQGLGSDEALRAKGADALRSIIVGQVALRRGNTASISVELGKRWTALYVVVACALGLGLVNLGLGVLAHRRRLRAERSERDLAAGLSTLQATAMRLARGDLATPVLAGEGQPDAFAEALESMRRDMVDKVAELEERNRAIVMLNDDLRAQIRQHSDDIESLAVRALDDGDDVRPGAVFAERYCVVRPIASGGSGDVYEVMNVADGRTLALKLLRTLRDAPSVARFAREARLLAELHHPHVVSVLQVGISDAGCPFLVMERARGRDLHREPIGDREALLAVLGQVASALDAAHAAGIVHRDVKPGNVVVDDGSDPPQAKLVDFGVARMGSRDEDSGLRRIPPVSPELASTPSTLDTHPGIVIGTPHFVAPELSEVGAQATAASDMFSFGVMAYRLLTGVAPFEKSPLEMARAGAAGVARSDLRELCPEVDAEVADLLMRCLDFTAAARPTARDVAARLLDGDARARRTA